MAELSEQTRRDLARLRRWEGPSVDAKQRVLATLELQIGGGFDGGGDGGGGPPATGNAAGAGYVAKVIGATVALTGAGLVTLRLGVLALSGLTPTPAQAPAEPPALGLEARAEARSPQPAPIELEPGVSASPLANPTPAPGQPRDRPRSDSEATGLADTDTLGLELAVLEAARGASTPARKLAELERHQREFPSGQLADERELMRVEVLCVLGRHEDARAIVAPFLDTHPDSSLSPRMRSACPELGLD